MSTISGYTKAGADAAIASAQTAAQAYADRYAGSAAGTDARPLAATDPAVTNSRVPTGSASGDLVGTYPNPALAPVGTAGTSGDASHSLTVTVDSKGRVTAITANPIAIAESQVTGLLADIAAAKALTALARQPDLVFAGAVTRDVNGAAVSAPVVWPGGSTGAYATLVASTAFLGLVDSWKVSQIPAGVLCWDSFARVASEVDGSLPDYSTGVWGDTGSAALGNFTIDGSSLVRTSSSTTGILLATIVGAAQDMTTKITANLSTANTGVVRQSRLITKWVDINNYVFANFLVSATGVPSLQIYKVIAGVQSQVGSTLNLTTVPTNSASNELSMTVTVSGSTVTATVNTTDAVTGTLAAGDVTALSTAVKAGIYTATMTTGDKIHDFLVTTPNAVLATAPTLYTQPTVTRDATTGGITNYPAIVVSN